LSTALIQKERKPNVRLRLGTDKFKTKEDYDMEFERRVLKIINSGEGFSTRGIADHPSIMKNFSLVHGVIKRLEQEGKLKRSETGRVEKTPEQKVEQEFKKLEYDAWIQTYPEVKRWIEYKSTTVEDVNSKLSRPLHTICNLLGLTPDQILKVARGYTSFEDGHEVHRGGITGRDSLDELMGKFAYEFKKQVNPKIRDGGLRSYRAAVIDYVKHSGIFIPERLGGNLSRAKTNYGKYSNTRLSDVQRDAVVRYAFAHFDAEIASAIAVGLEVVSPMSFTFRSIRVEQIEFKSRFGFTTAEFTVHESKTNEDFPKLAFDPRVVGILREIVQRKKTGYLFGTNGQPLDEGELSDALRECYRSIGIDVETEPENGLINYWKDKPIHSMRHSTAHLWSRRTGFNASIVAVMGWKTTDMVTQVYARLSLDYLFGQGRCDNCKPEQAIPTPDIASAENSNLITQSDHLFCSLKCACEFLNRKYAGTSFLSPKVEEAIPA